MNIFEKENLSKVHAFCHFISLGWEPKVALEFVLAADEIPFHAPSALDWELEDLLEQEI